MTESDASLGVANAPRGLQDDAVALPTGLALAASLGHTLMRRQGP